MTIQQTIISTTPFQFIEDDLKSERAKERILKRSPAVQLAKIITFFLGHNSDSFSAEPVYGPTGRSSLKAVECKDWSKILIFLVSSKLAKGKNLYHFSISK